MQKPVSPEIVFPVHAPPDQPHRPYRDRIAFSFHRFQQVVAEFHILMGKDDELTRRGVDKLVILVGDVCIFVALDDLSAKTGYASYRAPKYWS